MFEPTESYTGTVKKTKSVGDFCSQRISGILPCLFLFSGSTTIVEEITVNNTPDLKVPKVVSKQYTCHPGVPPNLLSFTSLRLQTHGARCGGWH